MFGTDDDNIGSKINVAIIRKFNDIDISIKDIQSFCMNKLASYKIPQSIYMVNKLPITGSGKVAKHQFVNKMYEIDWVNSDNKFY